MNRTCCCWCIFGSPRDSKELWIAPYARDIRYRANIFLVPLSLWTRREKPAINPLKKPFIPSSLFLNLLRTQRTSLEMKANRPRKQGNLSWSTIEILFILTLLSNTCNSVKATLILRPILKLEMNPWTEFVMQSGLLCLQNDVFLWKSSSIFLANDNSFPSSSHYSSWDPIQYK